MRKIGFTAGLVFFAISSITTIAQGVPFFCAPCNIAIYSGTGSGGINAPEEQADFTNPLIAPANLLGSATYTGALNFSLPAGGINTIGAFIASGGGTNTFNASVLNTPLSTRDFQATTLWVITGRAGSSASGIGGFITHDDGISLYAGGVALIHQPFPAETAADKYAILSGPWTLYYVEANDLPAVLQFDVARVIDFLPDPTPLPASVWMFCSVLAVGGGFAARCKRRRANEAIAA